MKIWFLTLCVLFLIQGSGAASYGYYFDFNEDFGSLLIFRKKYLGERQGSVRAVSRPLQLDSASLAKISCSHSAAIPLHCQMRNVPVVQWIGH